jgi:hypothetical protein
LRVTTALLDGAIYNSLMLAKSANSSVAKTDLRHDATQMATNFFAP